jgi:hypothetical protein
MINLIKKEQCFESRVRTMMNKAVPGMRASCKGGSKHGTVRNYCFMCLRFTFTSREIHISKILKNGK